MLKHGNSLIQSTVFNLGEISLIKESTIFVQLQDVVSSIDDMNMLEASLKLHSLTVPENDDDESLLGRYFFDAIDKKIRQNTWEVPNLYLLKDDEQINLFNLMNEKFPLVTEAKSIVTKAINTVVHLEKPLVILDIGIGTGKQISTIIKGLHKEMNFTNRVVIHGIDPSSQNLEIASQKLTSLSTSTNLEIEFYPIVSTIEDLSDVDWASIEHSFSQQKYNRLVNAAFSLHHSPPSYRNDMFHKLKTLQPDLLTIIEPDADFLTNDYTSKLANAWNHYHQAFSVINHMKINDCDKKSLKTGFFGREIHDLFSENCVEQYETGNSWIHRCFESGFKTLSEVSRLFPDETLPCGIELIRNSSYFSLNVFGKPVVSVMVVK